MKNNSSQISKLAFGCEPLGGTDWGTVNIKEIHRAIQYAFDCGISAFDVADVYGLGKAELELSKALGSKIREAFIITKYGVRWENKNLGERAKTYIDNSPEYMIKALESSLKRLNLEAIPLYFIHWPDEKTKLEVIVEALEKIKQEGKILNYGVSNLFKIEDLNEFKTNKLFAYQGPLNLVDFKRSLAAFEVAKKYGMKTFSYGPLAQGLLTGKFNKKSKFEMNDRRSRLPHFHPDQWYENNKILEVLNQISLQYDKSISQIAIRWVMDNCAINSVIVGAKNCEQVKSNIETLNFKLEKNDIDIINKVVGYESIAV